MGRYPGTSYRRPTTPTPRGSQPGGGSGPGSSLLEQILERQPRGGGLLEEVLSRTEQGRSILEEVLEETERQRSKIKRTPLGRSLWPLGIGLTALGLLEAIMAIRKPWAPPTGWTKIIDCTVSPEVTFLGQSASCATAFRTAINSGYPAPLPAGSPTTNTVTLFGTPVPSDPVANATVYPMAQRWTRVAGAPVWPLASNQPIPDDGAVGVPIDDPAIPPSPLTRRPLPAGAGPGGLHAFDPQPAPVPTDEGQKDPQSESGYTPPTKGSDPVAEPTPGGVTVPAPGGGPIIPTPPTVVREPPGPGTKERKGRVPRIIVQILHNVVNPITEALDVINAFWDALPDQYKDQWRYGNKYYPKAYHSPQRKLEILYQYWDKIDLNAAIDNLVMNQIEDYVYGKLGSKLGDASRLDNRPIGYGAGPAL